MIDWEAIKIEYITTSISTRDLARKHGVKYSTLRDRAAREGWCAERYRHTSKVVAKTEQKTAEAASDVHSSRILALMDAGEKAAALLLCRLDQMKDAEKINVYELKAITEALKTIMHLYTETDVRRDAERENDGLLDALNAVAYTVCNQDDSYLLPEAEDEQPILN